MSAEPNLDGRALTTNGPPSFCDIEVVRARAQFDALEKEWNALFERAGRADHVFQSFNWLWHWANHFLEDELALRIVVGRREGRLAMVWPLVEMRAFGLRKLVWMGEPVSQYGDALVESGPLADAILLEGWRRIGDLGADVAQLRKVRGCAAAHKLVAARSAPCELNAAPYADFRGKENFEAVLGRQSSKARSGRRRLLRRLQETGEISFSDPAAPADKAALVRSAFTIKRAWLAVRARYSGAIENDETLGFFLDAVTDEARPVETQIDAVYRDGAAIGVAISFVCKNEAFGHILTHEPGCDKQGAGVLLTEHVLRSSYARGMARFDTLAPADPYKKDWTCDAVPVCDHLIGFSMQGRLYALLWSSRARERLKTALLHLPAPLGRVLWTLLRLIKGRRTVL